MRCCTAQYFQQKSVPFGAKLFKSSLSATFSRKSANFIASRDEAREVLKYLQTISSFKNCPDKSFWVTMAGNKGIMFFILLLSSFVLFGLRAYLKLHSSLPPAFTSANASVSSLFWPLRPTDVYTTGSYVNCASVNTERSTLKKEAVWMIQKVI